ncbi:nitrilase-related carbon-nitrogen hydrolase [Alishewanella longhuensis]
MSTLTVAVLQTALVWQDCPANIQQLTAQLATLKPVDLIVLPEMFASGFSMDSTQIAEPEPGPALCWMQAQAVQYQCAITGSLAVRTQAGALVNRLYFVTPDGQVQHYDKRHLFRMAGEHQAYQAAASGLLSVIAAGVCYCRFVTICAFRYLAVIAATTMR